MARCNLRIYWGDFLFVAKGGQDGFLMDFLSTFLLAKRGGSQ